MNYNYHMSIVLKIEKDGIRKMVASEGVMDFNMPSEYWNISASKGHIL